MKVRNKEGDEGNAWTKRRDRNYNKAGNKIII